jgi:8-oxo-dGTP diphosphatase
MTTIGAFAIIFDEDRRILCVKRNYGPMNWTTPGGRLEKGESPIEGLIREVKEETGLKVKPVRLLGVYSTAFNDDMVLSIESEVIEKNDWQPTSEISAMGYFAQDQLPQPINPITQARIEDAFADRSGVIRVFSHPAEANG